MVVNCQSSSMQIIVAPPPLAPSPPMHMYLLVSTSTKANEAIVREA